MLWEYQIKSGLAEAILSFNDSVFRYHFFDAQIDHILADDVLDLLTVIGADLDPLSQITLELLVDHSVDAVYVGF